MRRSILCSECFLVSTNSSEWDLILLGVVCPITETCLPEQIIKITQSPQDTTGLKIRKVEINMGFINCLCGSLFVDLTKTVEGQYIWIVFREFNLVEYRGQLET